MMVRVRIFTECVSPNNLTFSMTLSGNSPTTKVLTSLT